jgi:hypothetical protein
VLARLSLPLPFSVAVSKTAAFTIYEYKWEGYIVRVFPPSYTEVRPVTDPDEITVNDEPGVLANVLRIDFQKDEFDRTSGGALDPSEQIITHAVNSFLMRLRHVARGYNVRPPDFPRRSWQLEYLNDDGTPLEPAEGLTRHRGAMELFSFTCVGLTPEIWAMMHDLPPEYEPPPWDALLLDAQGELPKIGTAIVLAATALEVFIARVLDQLATERALPKELWTWINGRDDHRQEPTVAEQYHTLLKFFTTHSLKEEMALWEAFQHLKQARNTFVHEGTARIGKVEVNAARAGELITAAGQVIAKIREWVPEHLQWKAYDHKLTIGVSKRLGPL